MKLVTVEQMQEIERRAAQVGVPPEILMENAGLAVAEEIRDWIGEVDGLRVLILIGPGNNGGDGLVVARHLHDWGAQVHLYMPRERASTDINYALVKDRAIHTTIGTVDQPEIEKLLSKMEVVVDAFFGTGRARALEGDFKRMLDRVSALTQTVPACTVVALDLPSGLNADNGQVDESCLTANLTVTLGYPKRGLFMFPGAKAVGQLVIADIGIPDDLADNIHTELITPEGVKGILPSRPIDANKGTFGKLLITGGSINYIGALYLACMGALRVGTGLVRLAVARSLHSILATRAIEVVHIPLPESEPGMIAGEAHEILLAEAAQHEALLIGCGLGQSASASDFLGSLILKRNTLPALLLDADALNILAKIPQWWKSVPQDAVITPHPGEMSRLTGLSISVLQSQRMDAAREAARSWNKTVVLKGAYTVVAAPDGRVAVNPYANPGLASAGTGDVLAGAIGGLLAQGLSHFHAAVAGVYLHSQAAELVRAELGDAGLVASDLLPELPRTIKAVKQGVLRGPEGEPNATGD